MERGRERGRERLLSRLHAQHGAQGSIPGPWDHDLSQNQELDTQLTELPRCPWNHFSDNEAEQVRVMEEVEKGCD